MVLVLMLIKFWNLAIQLHSNALKPKRNMYNNPSLNDEIMEVHFSLWFTSINNDASNSNRCGQKATIIISNKVCSHNIFICFIVCWIYRCRMICIVLHIKAPTHFKLPFFLMNWRSRREEQCSGRWNDKNTIYA